MTIADADWPYLASPETTKAEADAEAAWKAALRAESDAMYASPKDLDAIRKATAAQVKAYRHWMEVHARYMAESRPR